VKSTISGFIFLDVMRTLLLNKGHLVDRIFLFLEKLFYFLQKRHSNFDLEIEVSGVTAVLSLLPQATKLYLLALSYSLWNPDQ
jgi:hypothetical protein